MLQELRRILPNLTSAHHACNPGRMLTSGSAPTMAVDNHRRQVSCACACVLRNTFALALLCLTFVAQAAPRVPWTSNRIQGSPYPPSPYSVERLFPALTFENPVELRFLPNTQLLLVAEQSGKLWSFDTRAQTPAPASRELVLDFAKVHKPFDNVLGFAFHPGFATNRYLFVNYNEPGGNPQGACVSRFTFSSLAPPRLEPGSEKVFIRWLSGGHNGCTLAFGPDGFLYFSTGDAANPDPPDFPYRTGQDISDLLASVLRIDVDHPNGTNAYSIPADNPFIQLPEARPEVWAYGFRNPFRMSFDTATGDLWVGDVGWEQYEMIYRVHRGGNYGWSLTEGPNPNVRSDVRPGPTPISPPVVSLSHVDAASITGGQVYHGRRLSQLSGAYLYGDWETGKFWALRHRGDQLVSNEELCDTALKPISFVLDGEGELLILDYNGGLYRFVPNPAGRANEAFPRRLSETGLFTSVQPLQPAPGTIPYRINAPMWNDHATAEWLLAVPGIEAIATTGGVGNITGATWFFPTNTVLARTLTLDLAPGRRGALRHIETQVLHWDGQAWNPYSYRWNAEQSDASLVPLEGTNELFVVQDPSSPGGQRHTPWRFASRTECLRCHNAWAGDTITLNWLQLGLSTAPAKQTPPILPPLSEFGRLKNLGVLKGEPPGRPREARTPQGPLVNPHDINASLGERARSWLHANCAACHRFGAGGTAPLHLNFDKPLADLRTVDEKPTRGDFGLLGARIIAPADPYRSTLFYRISTEGAGRMPHLGSRLVDHDGVQLVRNWIRSLPPSSETTTATTTRPWLAFTAVLKSLSALNSTNRVAKELELLGTMNGSLALLDLVTSPGFPAATRAELGQLTQTHTNALVRDLFQQLLPHQQRRQTLGLDFTSGLVLSLRGNAAHGRQLFQGEAQCSRCHLCEGNGRNFGPDLSAIGRKYPPAQLLEQIVAPSKLVPPEYKTTYLTLKDDTELTGFILRRTAEELLFRDESATERRLKPTEIKETRSSTLSTMPEGLLAPLTAQEAADLLAYLTSLQ